MRSLPALVLLAATLAGNTWAADAPEVPLAIRNHRFEPAELKVPAGVRVKLVVHNQDSTPEEFESHSLNREKVIPAGAKATIFIGPLTAGRYEFFGDFNQKTAQGAIVAE
jgi:hypothetical protein